MIDHGHWTRVPGRNIIKSSHDRTCVSKIYTTSTSLTAKNNRYHVLSDNNDETLKKLSLPDGSVIYSDHSSIPALFEALSKFYNDQCGKQKKQIQQTVAPNSSKHKKIATETAQSKSLIERVREHTLKASKPKITRVKKKNSKKQKTVDNEEITIEFAQTLKAHADKGVQLTILNKATQHTKPLTTNKEANMTDFLYTNVIYKRVIDKCSDVNIEDIDDIQAMEIYNDIHSLMLTPFEEFQRVRQLNCSVSVKADIKRMREKAKEKLHQTSQESINFSSLVPVDLLLTPEFPLEALRGMTIVQARACLEKTSMIS